MYAIVASPLAKIFQPHLQDDLISNPQKIWLEDPVEIYIPRSCGRITFVLGQPKQMLTRQSSDKEEDAPHLLHWLCGGEDGQQNQETECYGVVQLDLSENVMSLVSQAVHSSMMSGKAPMMPTGVTEDITRAKLAAQGLSNARVMRAIRRCWEQLQNQYDLNTEAGLGRYKPSKTEILCQFVLKKEIAAEKARMEKIDAEIRDTLSEGHGIESMPDEFAKINAAIEGVKEGTTMKRKRRTKAEMAAAEAAIPEVDAFAASEEG